MAGALGDAAWMCGMERNSDIVLLESYAPLFVNVSDLARGGSMQWPSDLIGYDALTSYGSPSYYAQVMFSTHHGDNVLATDSQDIPDAPVAAAAAHPQRRSARRAPGTATNTLDFLRRHARQPERNDLPEGGEPPGHGANGSHSNQRRCQHRSPGHGHRAEGRQPGRHEFDSRADEDCSRHGKSVDGLGTDFTREFPPYSITILELKAK
jgi:hypothetical protein